MKFGIFFAYWEKDWKGDYFKYIKKVKNLGFDVLEISAGELLNMKKSELEELRTLSKDLDIGISCNLGPPKMYDIASSDPETRKNGIKFYYDLMDAMDIMGSKKLIGALYSYWPFDFIDLDKHGMWQRGVESCKIIARKAEDLGIDLCLEVLNRFDGLILNTAEEAVQYCKDVGSKAVKIHLDTFHMNMEEDYIPGAIRTAGNMLGHIHVSEGNRKLPHQAPGSLDWAEIGKALNDIGYDQYIIMEPFVKTGCQVGNDARIWRDLSNNLDETGMDQAAAASVNFLRKMFLK